MTLFLWHMTAYFVVLLVLWPIGVGREQDSAAAWWLLRPVFIGLSALGLRDPWPSSAGSNGRIPSAAT